MGAVQRIDKLDSPIFEAFSKSVDKQYIYICDVKTNIWRWSQYAVDCFGLPGEYVADLPDFWLARVHPEDRERVAEVFEKLFSGASAEHSCEYRVLNARDEYMWVLCRGCMVRDKNGEMELCAGILTDLESRNKFDPITGLLCFSEFRTAMGKILEKKENQGCVMLWGIDNFRRINEAYQYSFGNSLLNAYGKLLVQTIPDSCALYRMDGDQFAVICPNTAPERLTELFSTISSIGAAGIKIGKELQRFAVSAGAVTYPKHGKRSDEIYSGLEYALETSKKHCREGMTLFTEEMQEESMRLYCLQQLLRESVMNDCDGFRLCYQPLVSLSGRELVGAEALLRWTSPKFPALTPSDFIPLLEASGDINIVGKWVLSTALAQMREWLVKKPDMRISINVSYIQLKDPEFKYFVLQEVEKYQFPKEQLMLELTESCDVINPGELATELNFFREQGIQIALDDFGTGYASLSILRDLSADWIKVDHSFVAQIANNDFDKALTEHLINLCNELGLNVCVEGIETKEIQNVIQQYHPAVLQGYLYSRPIETMDFERRFIDSSIGFEESAHKA